MTKQVFGEDVTAALNLEPHIAKDRTVLLISSYNHISSDSYIEYYGKKLVLAIEERSKVE